MKPTRVAVWRVGAMGAGIARFMHKNIQGAPGSGAPWMFLCITKQDFPRNVPDAPLLPKGSLGACQARSFSGFPRPREASR